MNPAGADARRGEGDIESLEHVGHAGIASRGGRESHLAKDARELATLYRLKTWSKVHIWCDIFIKSHLVCPVPVMYQMQVKSCRPIPSTAGGTWLRSSGSNTG